MEEGAVDDEMMNDGNEQQMISLAMDVDDDAQHQVAKTFCW